VELRLSSNIGEIAKVASIINDMGMRIVSLVSTIDKDDSNVRTTLVRVDTDNTSELCRVLEDAGYTVIDEYRVEK
jgi:adenylylsulfate kinase-like enzyme